MAINYDKLLALKIPDAEHTYTDKDTILYALGVGLGQDPLDLKQLDFVYEKNLKALPTFAAMLGYPGFWVRELDTGIDWVRIVNGEQAVVLHQPLKPTGTVVGKSRVPRSDRQGAGQGRAGLCRAQGDRQGDGRADRNHDADDVLPCRRRLRRAAAREPAGAPGPRARAGHRVRSRHPARAVDDLPPVRRPQSAAHRPGDGQDRGLSEADPAWARHLRRRRPRAAQERVRLRPGACRLVRRALLGAGVPRRDHPHRDVARRQCRELPRLRARPQRGGLGRAAAAV